jgi:fructose-1,6-bisphosphatase/sedoheptulose 1,7-bisphosphatase-like protein
MTPHLTDSDLDEMTALLDKCRKNGAHYIALTDGRVAALLAMARRLREIERAWGVKPKPTPVTP